jgi:RNA polymerase sigma factor (sigma-70 family)
MEGAETWQRAHSAANRWLGRYSDTWTRQNREDLAQETMIAAWQWAGDLAHPERFGAAVNTIAIRVRGRALRERRRHEEVLSDLGTRAGEPEARENHFVVAGRRVPAWRVRPWLVWALDRLRPLDRRLLLAFHEGFCCAELAERFRQSLACVKTRIHRARRRVREAIEETARIAFGLDP